MILYIILFTKIWAGPIGPGPLNRCPRGPRDQHYCDKYGPKCCGGLARGETPINLEIEFRRKIFHHFKYSVSRPERLWEAAEKNCKNPRQIENQCRMLRRKVLPLKDLFSIYGGNRRLRNPLLNR